MPVFTVTHSGSFSKIENFLKRAKDLQIRRRLEECGKQGVEALSAATPRDTGLTASSWNYEISSEGGGYKIDWFNTNINKGINIAIIIQTGHGTRNGGYVEGIDYINPALKTVFDNMADDLWKEVTRL